MLTIDNVWQLESFVKQKGAGLGTNFGFVGLGQGGGKIVDAFAGIRNANGNPVYPVLCINTNKGDIDSLENVQRANRVQLKGQEFEKGAGMDPSKGRQAITVNGSQVFDAISTVMKDAEVIVVVASLGGGTGTGSINMVIDVCADYIGKPVMAIVSLPNPHIDENINAFEALKEIVPKLEEFREDSEGNSYRALENLIIIDNKKIIDEHIQAVEKGTIEVNLPWDRYSNCKVASILHEWNVSTTLESDKSLDAEDFKNKLLLTGGILTFAKKKINLQNVDLKSENDLIDEIVSTYREKNVLANGFDYQNDAIAFGITIVMPKNTEKLLNQDTLEKINRRLQEELQGVPIYYGRSTWDSKHALVYTICSLRGLPERAKNLKQESEELLAKQREREARHSGFDIGGELSAAQNRPASSRTRAGRAAAPANPFAALPKSKESAEKLSKPFNPFDQIKK